MLEGKVPARTPPATGITGRAEPTWANYLLVELPFASYNSDSTHRVEARNRSDKVGHFHNGGRHDFSQLQRVQCITDDFSLEPVTFLLQQQPQSV